MKIVNRYALVVVPKQPFLNWLHSADPTSADITLAEVSDEPSVYLIREWKTDKTAHEHLRLVFGPIFEEELDGWYRDRDTWPARRDFRTFNKWFECHFHSVVIDLSDGPLIREEM